MSTKKHMIPVASLTDADAVSVGESVLVRDFLYGAMEVFADTPVGATLKVRYALREGVDLSESSTQDNPWMYASLRETASQSEITELTLVDGVQAVAINIDLAYNVAPEITAITSGTVSATVFGSNNS